MKKIISIVLLLAMLSSLGAVAVLSGSAEGVQDERTAMYVSAEGKPTVDGVEDPVWKTAETHYIHNKSEDTNFRVLWNESGLYLFVTMTAEEKNAFRVHINESGNGDYKLHQLREAAPGDTNDQFTGAKLGNRIFYIIPKTQKISGHWLNETDKNALRKEWLPVPGENGVELAVKETADGGYNVEFFLPVFVEGTFNDPGEMYFAISWDDSTWNQNGIVTTNGGGLLTNNGEKWSKWFYKMKRVVNSCTHENGWNPATCVTPETCKDCGLARGEVATTHEKEAIWTYTETTHTQIYPCCEKKIVTDAPHEWETEYSVIKEPTCTREGEKTYLCKHCKMPDASKIVAVEPTGHDPDEWQLMKEPNCTKVGVEVRTCKICMAEVDSREVPATGHSGDEWIVTSAAQVGVEGKKHRICDECGEKFDEQAIPALDPPTAPVEEKGCGGSITVGALSVLLMLGGAALTVKKKKH